MSRYSLAVTLYDVELSKGASGDHSEGRVGEARVFANRHSVGLSTWAAGRSMGLHPDAVVAVRSCDYSGQSRCEVGGVEYSVESASCTGEFTRLVLKRRLSGRG